jgi:hypothetical protein
MDTTSELLDTVLDFFAGDEIGSDLALDDLGVGWLDSCHWCGDIDDIGDEF